MDIIGREKKTDSTWCSQIDIVPSPSNHYVNRLAELITSVKIDQLSFSGSGVELDNHANIVVAGSQYVILYNTKKKCTVNSLSESAERVDNIRIVDVIIAYDSYTILKYTFVWCETPFMFQSFLKSNTTIHHPRR